MNAIGRRAACVRLGVLAPALLLPWPAIAGQETPLDQRSEALFRSNVDLVHLSVTARDSTQRIVNDLRVGDFDIFEDGVRQQIGHFGHLETPISVVLLLDKSGSMAGDKMMHAQDGVINFVNALKAGDEALIIAFSDSIDALGEFGLNARSIEQAVKQLDAEAGTRLYDAVREGAREISTPGRKDKRALVILSDGADTTSRSHLRDAVEAVRVAQASTYAIAIEYDDEYSWMAPRPRDSQWRQLQSAGDLGPLHQLTDGTGGWTYEIRAAKRCKEVCLRIADELRNQYLLGYYPTNTVRDGNWRAIQVRTNRLGVTLATRTGYYAPRS